jgi:chaperonin GroES
MPQLPKPLQDAVALQAARDAERSLIQSEEEPVEVEPYYDRLVVRVLDPQERSPGGIILPAVAIENTPFRYGEVVAVGQGRMSPATGELVPMHLSVGDVVMFFRTNNGEQITIPSLSGASTRDLLIREPHVLARVRNPTRLSAVLGAGGEPLIKEST